MTNYKSIVFVNQSSGYLMIDIINAHAPYYDELVLLTGFYNPRGTKLDPKVKIKYLKYYNRSSNLLRFYSWFVFHLQSLFYIFYRYKKSKIYFVSNPPINVFSFKIINREYAYLVYDMYPQALVKKNILKKSSIIYKNWICLNKRMYDSAKHIFTLNEAMKNSLSYIKNPSRIIVAPIWTNSSFFYSIPSSKNIFLKKNNLKNKFIVSYSGNLGKTHPIEKIFFIAESLKEIIDIQFLIIGNGEKKASLIKMQKEKNLPNLQILDFQPTSLFPHVLAAINIGIVTLDTKSADISIPSKTFDLMSASKPIISISSHDSELANIISQNKIGQNFDQNTSINEIGSFILELKNNFNLYNEISKNSYAASLKFTPKIAEKMILL